MKKVPKIIFYLMMILCFGFIFTACDTKSNNSPPPDNPTIEKPDDENIGDINMVYVNINGDKWELTLENNNATQELVKKLQNGNIQVSLRKNGNFEQYGDLGFTLPTSDQWLNPQCGDVFLYSSRYICLFYNENPYSYTKLGRITNKSNVEISNLLSDSNVTITLSLT